MTQSFTENKSHLSKLSILDDLKKSVNEIKMSSAGQIGSLREEKPLKAEDSECELDGTLKT